MGDEKVKWFKHDCDMHTDLKIQALIDKYDTNGYAIYNLCLEILGEQGKKARLSADLCWKVALAKTFSKVDSQVMDEILEFMGRINLICPKSLKKGELYIPKFIKRLDDYTSRKIRTMSEHSTDNVHLDKSRVDKIRIEYIRVKNYDISSFLPNDYARVHRAIKTLLIKAKGSAEDVIAGLGWINTQRYEWTLETLIRKWPDFMLYHDKPQILKDFGKEKHDPRT